MTLPARDERRWTLYGSSADGKWSVAAACPVPPVPPMMIQFVSVEVMPVSAHEAALAAAEHAATSEGRYNTQHWTLHSAEDVIAELRGNLAALREAARAVVKIWFGEHGGRTVAAIDALRAVLASADSEEER